MTDSPSTSGHASTSEAVDDAGKAIRVPNLREIAAAREDDPALRTLVVRLRSGIRSLSLQDSWLSHDARVLATLIGAGVCTLLIGAAMVGIFGSSVSRFACPLFVIVAIIWHRALRSIEARKFSGFLARSIVAEGLCGQCLYELVGTTTQTRGLFNCPECGAAWLAERWRAQTLAFARRHASDANVAAPTATDRDAFLRWCLTHRRPERIIADDRGNFTSAPKSWLDDFPEPPRSEAELAELTQLAMRIRGLANHRRRDVGHAVVGFAAVLCGLIAIFGIDFTNVGYRDCLFLLAPFAFAVIVILILNGSELGIPPREVALCLASSGRCGACAHPLHDAPIENGLRVCPKCHAAWYVPIP